MKQKNIPEAVLAEARRQGFNWVSHSGTVDGSEVYGVGVVDAKGEFPPIGLPTFIVVKDGRMSMVSGDEGLELACRL